MTVPCDDDGAKVPAGAWAKVRHHCTWKRELLPIKLILFLYTGGMMAFLPFLTLQMKQLGITVKEIAVIHAFLPVASLLGPPTSGLVADIFQQYRLVLGGNIVLTLTLHCLLLQVPPRPPISLTMTCGEGGHALAWGYCSPCHGGGAEGVEGAYMDAPTLTLKECRSTCMDMPEVQLCLHEDTGGDYTCHKLNYTSKLTLHGSLLAWKHTPTNSSITTTTSNTTTSIPPIPPPEYAPLPFTSTEPTCGHAYRLITGVSKGDDEEEEEEEEEEGGGGLEEGKEGKENRINNEKGENTILKEELGVKGGDGGQNTIGKHEKEEKGEMEEKNRENRIESEGKDDKTRTNEANTVTKTGKDEIKEEKEAIKARITRDVETTETSTQTVRKSNTATQPVRKSSKKTRKTSKKTKTQKNTDTAPSVISGEWSRLTCPNLPHTCPITCKVEGFDSCDHPEDPSQGTLTFWVYFTIRILGTFFLASSFTMMDATSLALVKQHNAEFGKQRILATIGQATIPLLAGILVDAHSSMVGYNDYMPAIYLGSSLALIATLIVLRLDVKIETGNEKLTKDLRRLVTNVEIDLFLVMILILGSNWGFIESYLFLYLNDLNAPNYLLGLTLTVGCFTGVPIMYVADKVIDKLGRPAIFIISFFAYAARHFGYAFMTDPWMVFPYELLEIFTYQIMWVAAVTYCHVLAPKGLLATMTGLAGATHYSLGRGFGSLFGGYLIANLGMAITFRIFGYVSFAGGIFYLLVHFVIARRRRGKEEEEEEKDPDEMYPMMDLGIRRGSEGFAP